MEARHLLKKLKDDGWYLGDTAGASRLYIHPEKQGVITVGVRFTDELGPETLARATSAATSDATDRSEEPTVEVETTRTGVSTYSPELPGCVATGADEAEARSRMAEALALHRKRLEEHDE